MSTELQAVPFDDDKHLHEHEEAVPKDDLGNSQQEINDLIHKPTKWANFGFYWQFSILSCAWILFGFDVGIVGSLIGLPFFIERFQGPSDSPIIAFTPQNINLTVTVAIVGSTVAPLISPFLQKRFGRKKTILIAYGGFCVPASLLQLFAPNISALAIGRFFNFAGVTLAEQVVIPYINEVVPARFRGRAVALSGGFNGVFQIFATCIMYGCSQLQSDWQWRIPLIIQCGLPVLLFVLSLTLRESVSYLIKHDRIEEATAVQTALRRADRPDLVAAEVAAILSAVEDERTVSKQGRFLDIFKRQHLRRTIGASLLGCLTACSGLGLTSTYGVVILQSVGIADPFRWNVLNSVLSFLGLIAGGFIIDRIGRRPLVLGGLAVVAALDFTAGGIATTGLKTYDQGIGLAAISIILSFFCQIAFAGVYLLVSECPNMILREYTIAYSIWVNLASTIISTVGFPYLLGPPGLLGPKVYLICGGFVVAGGVAAFFLIPETKNKTWSEIDEMYNNGVPCWRMSTYKGSAMERVSAATRDLKNGQVENTHR